MTSPIFCPVCAYERVKRKMKLKDLHAMMQDIQPFTAPKPDLEQYPTGPHLASRMLYTIASSFDDFEGRTVLDLGCGTGMLAIGAALLGASAVLGLEIDPDALELAQDNLEQFEEPLPVDFLLCNVVELLESQRAARGEPSRSGQDDGDEGDEEGEGMARGGRGRSGGGGRRGRGRGRRGDRDGPKKGGKGGRGRHRQAEESEGSEEVQESEDSCAGSGEDGQEGNDGEAEGVDAEGASAQGGAESAVASDPGPATPVPPPITGTALASVHPLAFVKADTVIMNPPFGTKRRGVDMEFLRAAAALATGTIYSLNKTSTRAHIQKVAERELGLEAEVVAELRYDLPATMKFHKQKSVDIEVDLWRFVVRT